MVKIRLKKIGMRHQPSYRIVAIESRRSRDGEYLESLGHYDPRRKLLELDVERVDYWLSRGAQATDTTSKLIKRYTREHPTPGEEAGVAAPEGPEAAAAPPPEAATTATTGQERDDATSSSEA